MDYAFAPGGSDYDDKMQILLSLRAGTTLVTPAKAGQTTIAAFLKYLNKTPSIAKPVGDLLIASHGSDEGWMEIALDDPTKADAVYEQVEKADKAKTINVPSSLINTTAGAAPMTIHIRGCRIGQAQPFMTLLKHAFGGQAKLTAPLFFHQLRGEGVGVFEYLGYSFAFPSQTALASRNDVIQAFQDLKLPFLDGKTKVPDDKWEDWIPPNVGEAHQKRDIFADLGQTIGKLGTKLTVTAEFRHDVDKDGFVIKNQPTDPGAGISDPVAKQAARLAQLKKSLPTDEPQYRSTHPYPVYKRLGYESGDDFVDGYVWKFTYSPSAKTLTCSGKRHRYTVIVPVTDLATGALLYNFYPKPGSSVAAVSNLPDTNPQLFLTV
jgi:hypothetical protein